VVRESNPLFQINGLVLAVSVGVRRSSKPGEERRSLTCRSMSADAAGCDGRQAGRHVQSEERFAFAEGFVGVWLTR
jgi:hypothetical protein